jgi:signal peptidase II
MHVTALLLAAIVVVALDQSTKSLALVKLREGRVVGIGFVAIRTVLNRRMGWIIWNSEAAPVLLLLVEFALLVAVVQFGGFFTDAVAPAALGAALGGASSNLIDRLWRGGVVDFIDLKVWPVFNLADVAIVLGVLISAFQL